MKTELLQKLNKLANIRSTAFCYECYKKCPSGVCPTCQSDDLMRHVEGVGVEYGTGWIVKDIVENELKAIDVEESYEQMIYELYGDTTKVAFSTVDTVAALKELSPTDYRIGLSEHEDYLLEDEDQYIELYGNVYSVSDVEDLVDGIDDEEDKTA